MDYIKNVISPIRQVAPRQTLRGFQEDYGSLTADVVYLEGEIHYERKPVSPATYPRLLSKSSLYIKPSGRPPIHYDRQ